MGGIYGYDTSQANNTTTIGGLGLGEGSTDPKDINNALRTLAAHLAQFLLDISGSATTGGSSNVYTLSTSSGIGSLANGKIVVARINHTNTSTSPTLNVDSAGAKDIRVHGDAAPADGDLQEDAIGVFVYRTDGDGGNGAWMLANPYTVPVGALPQIATNRVLGNVSGGTAAASALTPDNVNDILEAAVGDLDLGVSDLSATEIVATTLLKAIASTAILELENSGAAANNKRWQWRTNGTSIQLQALTDAGSGGGDLLRFTRSGNQITGMYFGSASGGFWLSVDEDEVAMTAGGAFGGEKVTIADDAAYEFESPNYCYVFVTANASNYSASFYGSPDGFRDGNTSGITLTTGALSGTTGANGAVTSSRDDGSTWVENRSGTARDFIVTHIGRYP